MGSGLHGMGWHPIHPSAHASPIRKRGSTLLPRCPLSAPAGLRTLRTGRAGHHPAAPSQQPAGAPRPWGRLPPPAPPARPPGCAGSRRRASRAVSASGGACGRVRRRPGEHMLLCLWRHAVVPEGCAALRQAGLHTTRLQPRPQAHTSAGGTATKKSPGASCARAATAVGWRAQKQRAPSTTQGLQRQCWESGLVQMQSQLCNQRARGFRPFIRHHIPNCPRLSSSTPRMPRWRASSAARKRPVPPPTSHRAAPLWRPQS